ncbi:hypothetical protein GALMADRAFT_1346526 [Galerina marginata CBS 339.88]|uniref:Uncharacterized protein n=1 Tax=Galerina marginata (strain CBS 339.88) TaxID=685588 RepID=A0A067ST70_GALM3|nr:hypothetical protein GALMADRAFT_1346526 [Galerina marginata CBS 339.88]
MFVPDTGLIGKACIHAGTRISAARDETNYGIEIDFNLLPIDRRSLLRQHRGFDTSKCRTPFSNLDGLWEHPATTDDSTQPPPMRSQSPTATSQLPKSERTSIHSSDDAHSARSRVIAAVTYLANAKFEHKLNRTFVAPGAAARNDYAQWKCDFFKWSSYVREDMTRNGSGAYLAGLIGGLKYIDAAIIGATRIKNSNINRENIILNSESAADCTRSTASWIYTCDADNFMEVKNSAWQESNGIINQCSDTTDIIGFKVIFVRELFEAFRRSSGNEGLSNSFTATSTLRILERQLAALDVFSAAIESNQDARKDDLWFLRCWLDSHLVFDGQACSSCIALSFSYTFIQFTCFQTIETLHEYSSNCDDDDDDVDSDILAQGFALLCMTTTKTFFMQQRIGQ